MNSVTPERRRYLDERNAKIAELYRQGVPTRVLAKMFNLHRTSIQKACNDAGIHAKWPDPQRIVELTKAGWSLRQIANELHCTDRTVSRHRENQGVTTSGAALPLTEDEILRAKMFLEDGCSYSEVGRTLGRSPRTIQNHFPDYEWTDDQIFEFARMQKEFRRLCHERGLTYG